jgi:hypothetical protein
MLSAMFSVKCDLVRRWGGLTRSLARFTNSQNFGFEIVHKVLEFPKFWETHDTHFQNDKISSFTIQPEGARYSTVAPIDPRGGVRFSVFSGRLAKNVTPPPTSPTPVKKQRPNGEIRIFFQNMVCNMFCILGGSHMRTRWRGELFFSRWI